MYKIILLIILLIFLINFKGVKESFKNGTNINNGELQVCSLDPLTGYYRNGYCQTDETDKGTHTLCGKVTTKFLEFTKSRGNDLTTKRGSFPGLKNNDYWCLCANRWKEAYNHDKNIAPEIKKDATNIKTFELINKDILSIAS